MSDNFKGIFAAVLVSVVSLAVYDFFARPALDQLLKPQAKQ